MKTVLVIENYSPEKSSIVALLREAGFNVVLADTAESVLNWSRTNGKPDLIVLDIIDIIIPGACGLDICRQLCDRSEMENVPIIFCFSKNQDLDRFWALQQSENADINKSRSPTDLADTIYEQIN
ncbi:MAG: response regulator [Cyanosarcina radialis HA8281-LM2]|jgi:twitching motility two-component system response regulator PilH|nr:response regulator [Cyanosarcina radialis HA8281-LM2]